MAQDVFEKLLSTTSLDELRAQRAEYRRTIDEYEQRLTVVGALIELLEMQQQRSVVQNRARRLPDQPSLTDGIDEFADLASQLQRPTSLIDSIERVMQTDPEGEWTGERVLDELKERGWQPRGKTPRNSVDATLSRLRSLGRVSRVNPGVYKLPAGMAGASETTT